MFSVNALNTGIIIPPTYGRNNRLRGGELHQIAFPDFNPRQGTKFKQKKFN
jgi:hypothetical protein